MRNGTDVRNASACYRWLRWMAVPVALCGLSANATQYVVPGGAGDKSGGSWANAREDVQAAVNAATLPGEEVWVAAGRYEVAAPVALRSGSVVLGGFAGTENAASQRNWDANVTILDGLDATRVVSMEDIVSGRLDGLVVTRGYVSVTNGMGGGGILIQGSEGCEVANCKILHNRSVRATGATACEGGGIYLNYGTNCVIANCLFTENTSVSYGTSLSIRNSTGVTVSTCRFVGCFMDGTLGVVRVQSNISGIQFSNCLASGNKAYYGSFIYAAQDMSAINCTVCCTTNSSGVPFIINPQTWSGTASSPSTHRLAYGKSQAPAPVIPMSRTIFFMARLWRIITIMISPCT
ncbi:MAG: right-handed parallel beta-helix repeat-containing protein [Kiritimatiellae bacterium]|nr:right-handed parallel beta-helix repeat-containing protein [Kiritimatiellia bacterium]